MKLKIAAVMFMAAFLANSSALAGPAAFTGQVSADDINVRVDATVTSVAICTLEKGSIVEVVSEAYEWYKIRLPQNAPSYVRKDLVECINLDPVSNPGKCLSAKVVKDRINIRLEPNESSWILGKINRQVVVNVISETKGWYRIQPVHESYGWVNKKFISKEIKQFLKKAPAKEVKTEPAEVKLSGKVVVEGMISPYGIVLWRKATHKLITLENKLYFLKGNRKSLNSLNYRKVKVLGEIIAPEENRNPIIEVDVVEVLN